MSSLNVLDEHLSMDDISDSLDKFEDFGNIEKKQQQKSKAFKNIMLCQKDSN